MKCFKNKILKYCNFKDFGRSTFECFSLFALNDSYLLISCIKAFSLRKPLKSYNKREQYLLLDIVEYKMQQ